MREILTNIKKPELVTKRRNQIMKTAMKLFRRNGYHATTMREICKHARVNMGSFYDYFGSKQDILVYIYKEMIFGGRVYDQAFPEENVSTWNDLEPFLKSLTFNAWNRHKNPIQLLYRETISLDKGTMREVLKIESEYVRWIAENLRKGLGRSSVNQELEIIANSIALINAFLPLRGWNMHHLDQERILDSIVDMVMSKLKALRRHPPRSGSV